MTKMASKSLQISSSKQHPTGNGHRAVVRVSKAVCRIDTEYRHEHRLVFLPSIADGEFRSLAPRPPPLSLPGLAGA